MKYAKYLTLLFFFAITACQPTPPLEQAASYASPPPNDTATAIALTATMAPRATSVMATHIAAVSTNIPNLPPEHLTATIAGATRMAQIKTTTPPIAVTPTLTATPDILLTTNPCPPSSVNEMLVSSANAADYLGIHVKNFPPDWLSLGGNEIGEQAQIRVFDQPSGRLLWLEKELCSYRDNAGYDYSYQVIADAMFLPVEDDNGNRLYFVDTCWKKEDYPAEPVPGEQERHRWDETLVAVGYFEDVYEKPTAILWAWQVNLELGKFEPIPPETISCTGLLGL